LRLSFSRVSTGETVTETARALVGADGVDSGVAQDLGMAPVPSIVNLQARVVLPDGIAPDTACVWFNAQDTPYFYWLVPEGPDRAVVGLAADGLLRAKERLAGFLNERGWQPLSYQVSRVAAYRLRVRPWARVGESLVYLVVDAAGQVKVTTIGGVVTGLWGARAVAQAIIEGRGYQAALGRAGWELDLHWVLRAVLNRFTDDDYDALLRLLNEKTLALLRIYNRDQLTGMWWKLLLAQPGWVPFLSGLLVRGVARQVAGFRFPVPHADSWRANM
jgi:flavin-dependent dehydrogenase